MDEAGVEWLCLHPAAEADRSALPDLTNGTEGWGRVATPSGGTARWTQAGSRFFVELDPAVLSPLQPLLTQGHPGRDLRRRVSGYDVVTCSGGKGGRRPSTFAVEMDGLASLLDQEWVLFNRRCETDPERKDALREWKGWGAFMSARQPMYSSASRDEAAPAPSSPSSLGPSVANAIDSLPCGESAAGSPHDSSQPPHKRLKGPWHDAMHADSEATMAELSASAVALLPTPPPSAMQPAIESSQEVMPELTASAVDLLPTPPSSPPLPSIMADFRDLCEDFAQREEVRPSEAEFENVVASVGDLLLSGQMDSDDDDVDNDGDSDDGGNDGVRCVTLNRVAPVRISTVTQEVTQDVDDDSSAGLFSACPPPVSATVLHHAEENCGSGGLQTIATVPTMIQPPPPPPAADHDDDQRILQVARQLLGEISSSSIEEEEEQQQDRIPLSPAAAVAVVVAPTTTLGGGASTVAAAERERELWALMCLHKADFDFTAAKVHYFKYVASIFPPTGACTINPTF